MKEKWLELCRRGSVVMQIPYHLSTPFCEVNQFLQVTLLNILQFNSNRVNILFHAAQIKECTLTELPNLSQRGNSSKESEQVLINLSNYFIFL